MDAVSCRSRSRRTRTLSPSGAVSVAAIDSPSRPIRPMRALSPAPTAVPRSDGGATFESASLKKPKPWPGPLKPSDAVQRPESRVSLKNGRFLAVLTGLERDSQLNGARLETQLSRWGGENTRTFFSREFKLCTSRVAFFYTGPICRSVTNENQVPRLPEHGWAALQWSLGLIEPQLFWN